MGRKAFQLALLLAIALHFANLQAQATPEPLIVHEWGTFTSLQNEAGEPIGGINTDDEPVPQFVHRLTEWLLLSPTEVPASFFQGAPSCHPDVTLRLETPVLYFHLPGSWTHIPDVSVSARFRGGWLTEFYPNALADAPGVSKDPGGFGPLRTDTVSSLTWKNLDVGGRAMTTMAGSGQRVRSSSAKSTPVGNRWRPMAFPFLEATSSIWRSAGSETRWFWMRLRGVRRLR
jgi:hypothetical protein